MMRLNSFLPTNRNRNTDQEAFRDLRREMGRVFDQFNSFPSFLDQNLDLSMADDFLDKPNMDVVETDKDFQIKIDVPGVKEEDLDIQLDGRLLSIKGQRESENTEEEQDYKIVERSSGSFKRSIRLPFEPDSKTITGDLDAGVLTITVTKPAEASQGVKRISIGKGAKKAADKKPAKESTEEATA